MADQRYTRADVAGRNGQNEAPLWIIVKDAVYDVSAYLQEHPGGVDALKEQAGKDATKEFESIGHSDDAREVMKKFKIGVIVEKKKAPSKGPAKPSNQLVAPRKPLSGSIARPPPTSPEVSSNGSKPVPTGLPLVVTSTAASVIVPTDLLVSNDLVAPIGSLLEASTAVAALPTVEPAIGGPTVTSMKPITASGLPSEAKEVEASTASVDSVLASKDEVAKTSITMPAAADGIQGEHTVISAKSITGFEGSPARTAGIEAPVDLSTMSSDVRPPNEKLSSDTTKQSSISLNSSSMTSQGLPNSTLSEKSTAVSSKSGPIQPGLPTILSGISKVSITPTKAAAKQAQLPWSSFNQSGTKSASISSMNNTSFKNNIKQLDPFKNNKMGFASKKK